MNSEASRTEAFRVQLEVMSSQVEQFRLLRASEASVSELWTQFTDTAEEAYNALWAELDRADSAAQAEGSSITGRAMANSDAFQRVTELSRQLGLRICFGSP